MKKAQFSDYISQMEVSTADYNSEDNTKTINLNEENVKRKLKV